MTRTLTAKEGSVREPRGRPFRSNDVPMDTSNSNILFNGLPNVPLAVIGWSHRFPGDAETSDGFWRMLCEGRTAHGPIPKERFNIDAFYHPDHTVLGTMNVATGHFLRQDIAAFDASFFGIQPSEAAAMDPQQRLLLETAYHAFENAGLTMDSLEGSNTSVHVGAFTHDYECIQAREPEHRPPYLATGIGGSILANRISWFFNLHGESMVIDTACSSSLTCLHLASRALQTKDSNIALVGGVNIIIAPDSSYFHHSNMGFFSPDGHSYAFDERANGYGKGEGTAVVVLKRLDDAVRDGDTIRAVIGAAGANQDGRTPGITQPSAHAQEMNMRSVHERCGINANDVQYIEAHGTGTQAGDPIECTAITRTFERSSQNPLIVGALKPNVGHLEAVAGLASLIKAILCLEKCLIPPNALYRNPNPRIDLQHGNLKFPSELISWPIHGPRTAAVSSFGYGGSNAYVVLHDALHFLEKHNLKGRHNSNRYPAAVNRESGSSLNGHVVEIQDHSLSASLTRIFLWSATDEATLRRMVGAYEDYLNSVDLDEGGEDNFLRDLCFTLSSRRTVLPWKTFVVAHSLQSLRENLSSNIASPTRSSSTPALVYVFTGQGAQWFAMGRELIYHPSFAQSLRRAENILKQLQCNLSPKQELSRDEQSSKVHQPLMSQILCTVLQLALVDLLEHCGIYPDAVLGHSSGEIPAAYCAGGLSFESAVQMAYHRGYHTSHLVGEAPSTGGMISVQLSVEDIQPFINETLEAVGGMLVIACENSPRNITLAGSKECIEHISGAMEQQGIFAAQLKVPVAYHSPQMSSAAVAYASSLKGMTARTSEPGRRFVPCKIFSTVTGNQVDPEVYRRSSYWIDNMVSTVRFAPALTTLVKFVYSDLLDNLEGRRIHFMEIGPHAALRRPVKDTLSMIPSANVTTYDSLLLRGCSASQSFLEAIGRLRCNGFPADLSTVNDYSACGFEGQQLTDLPSYPFNHSQKYWLESRIDQNYRSRPVARHELLGVPAMDWNPLEPHWNHRLKVTENPWMRDHHVDASHVYPAAGMIAMVMEAARQASTTPGKILGYYFTNIEFLQPLKVDVSGEGVEVQLRFERRRVEPGSSNEHNFALYSYANGEWARCFLGTVVVEIAGRSDSLSRFDNNTHDMIETYRHHSLHPLLCTETIDGNDFYENLSRYGYRFGPAHQTLQAIRYSTTPGEACAHIDLDSWLEKYHVPLERVAPHVIHPTDLDGIIQVTLAALSKAGTQAFPTMVPTGCRSLWFSGALLCRHIGSRIHAFARTTSTGFSEVDHTIVALDNDHTPVVVMEGWHEMAVSTLDISYSTLADRNRLYFSVAWKPDIEQLSPCAVQRVCNDEAQENETAFDVEALELLSMYYTSVVVSLTTKDISLGGFGSHTQKYVQWAKQTYCDKDLQRLMLSIPGSSEKMENEISRNEFIALLSSQSIECQLTAHVGKHIEMLLRGEVNPLEVVYDERFINDFYRGQNFQNSFSQVRSYVALLAHKNPNLKILEIGAGTGAGTTSILPALVSVSESDETISLPKFEQYDFTDISPQYFEQARHQLGGHTQRFNFMKLDIEKDPIEQGFSERTYDLVYASLVLHATSNIAKSLQNARKLLKPGGKLVLLELTNLRCARYHFIFGLLPGWWLSDETNRKFGPLLTSDQWDTALKENGFSGAEISMADNKNSTKLTFQVLIASAVESTFGNTTSYQEPLIVIDHKSAFQSHVARSVLTTLGCAAEENIVTFTELSPSICHGRNFIALVELDQSWLRTLEECDFQQVKILLHESASVMWTTAGAGRNVTWPDRNMVTGIGRNARSENSMLKFTHLAFDDTEQPQKITDLIISVYLTNSALPVEQCEDLYHVSDGQLWINRVFGTGTFNDKIRAGLEQHKPRWITLEEQEQRNLALTVGTPGLLDSLHFIDDNTYNAALGDLEIEVLPAAVGLNFRDVLTGLGKLHSRNLGLEFSGIVHRAGVQSELRPGDRVFGMTPNGAFRTRIRTLASTVVKINDKLSFEAAAALPVIWATAYYSLVMKASLQRGETVLIHSGAGGVGQAAIQVARHLGAIIFVTVGTPEKKQFLIENYGIPEAHIFSSRTTDFADSISRMTDGNGVDVILNSLSGNMMRASWSIIAPLGRFVELGKADLMSNRGLQTQQFLKNVSFISVDLVVLMQKAPHTIGNILNALVRDQQQWMFETSKPLQTFTADKLERAFRWFQGGNNIGKAVVLFHPPVNIMATPPVQSTYQFFGNCTYVIAGGFGGIGGVIVKWMVSRGARYFWIPSRSGQDSQGARKLLAEVATSEVSIVGPCCDITNEAEVEAALRQIEKTMPPIKGCIQATAVLRDALLTDMTYTAWDTAVQPKVNGTWNLHKHLPKNMDFFVALSSVASILGSRGQANYAAGNAYLDSFVRYRRGLGQRACALNLGPVKSVGIVAEAGYEKDILKDGIESLTIDDLLMLLDHACDPTRPQIGESSNSDNVVTGLAGLTGPTARDKSDIFWLNRPFLSCLKNSYPVKSVGKDDITTVNSTHSIVRTGDLLKNHAASDAEAVKIVVTALRRKLSRALNISVDDVESTKPVHAYGVDSLVALELRNACLKEVKANVTVFEIMGAKDLNELCKLVWSKSSYRRLEASSSV